MEFACAAHSQLLRNYGLLDAECSVVGSGPVVAARDFQGLVIDDFFAISVEPKSDGRVSRSVKAFNTAQRAYHDFSLIGSPDKDVKGATRAKVIGAEVAADDVALCAKAFWIILDFFPDCPVVSYDGLSPPVVAWRLDLCVDVQEAFHVYPSRSLPPGS